MDHLILFVCLFSLLMLSFFFYSYLFVYKYICFLKGVCFLEIFTISFSFKISHFLNFFFHSLFSKISNYVICIYSLYYAILVWLFKCFKYIYCLSEGINYILEALYPCSITDSYPLVFLFKVSLIPFMLDFSILTECFQRWCSRTFILQPSSKMTLTGSKAFNSSSF